ncbi:MAG: Tyrosine recombinase XerC [Candidatus Anoxychlamydiales bacterium]|nr:Tyrosine recombinase XerC [Candidatus Anoxychlamydiales bacterium]
MATIQKRKNKNKTFSYRVMIRPKDGLPPTYKTFPVYQEAKDWAIEEEARRRQGIYFPDQIKKKQTLSELIDKYIELDLAFKSKSSKDTLRHLHWWKNKIGKFSLNHITPDLIAKHRKELMEGITSKGTQRSPATTNRYLASLSIILSYGVKECGWISINPMLRVSKLKEAKGRDRILSKKECERLLKACSQSKSPFLLPIVTLAICTGMRQGEILKLTWGNINFEQKIISLKETKNGYPRSIPLVGSSFKEVKKIYQNRNPHNPFVFPSKKRFGEISIRKPWETALKKAKIENFRFHDLRHTFATFAAKGGASNLALATAMGHRSLSMLSRYTHMDVTHTKQLSEFVEKTLLSN